MNKESEQYFIICQSWSLDSNQWSILIGAIGVLLTLIGFFVAFILYNRQRNDASNDAFEYFQSSLPELEASIEDTIKNLKEFTQTLDSDNFINPILSASLNDKFLSKIDLVDLNRFYSKKRKSKLNQFKLLITDSNFFGDYHAYFTNEINYFRTNYLEKENTFSQWQLLRSNKYFSTIADENERQEYKYFYVTWVNNLNNDNLIFEFNEIGEPIKLINRKRLAENQIRNLAQNIFPFIQFSEKANEVNLIANKIVSAYADITEIKTKVKSTFEKDIKKFENILNNLKNIIE